MNIPILHFNEEADGEPPCPLLVSGRSAPALDLAPARAAQRNWAALPVADRMGVLRRFRSELATNPTRFVRALAPRDEAHVAELLATQIIPLADACEFLEREASRLLAPRRVGRRGRPTWLAGASAEVHREACGAVLVVAPSNYPLLLPGVVVLQALAAGNAVVLKPGHGGADVARELIEALHRSGLDPALTVLLDEHPAGVMAALDAGVDKLVFTGGARTGTVLLSECASRLVPAVMELSGSDAMFVRADADVPLAVRALLFGLRVNRGATCIAPRRVFVHESRFAEFEAECVRVFSGETAWTVPAAVAPAESSAATPAPRWRRVGEYPAADRTLAGLIVEAAAQGARVIAGEVDHHGHTTVPLLVAEATPAMRLLREDHFASVAALVRVSGDDEALGFNDQCPYALGASIFSGNLAEARALAGRINAGSVLINDVIVPTADPRLPFGGRKQSGFGLTRGPEGLLELTNAKVVSVRRGTWRPHFAAPQPDDPEFFSQYLALTHAPRWSTRWKSALSLLRAALNRKKT